MRWPVSIALAAAVGLSSSLLAEPPPPDELLVVGLKDKEGALATWTADGKGLKLAGPGVAVPRGAAGWWRLDRVRRTSATADDTRLFAAKAGQKLTLPPLDVQEGCESVTREDLFYAGPDAFSFESTASSDCEGAMRGLATVLLRSATYENPSRVDPLGVSALFGPALASAWSAAAAKAHGGQEKRQLDCFAEAESTDVGLVHARGRWLLRGELNFAVDVCRGKFETFDVEADVPDKLAGGAGPLPKAWDALAEANPGLVDAVASPSGELVLYVYADRVELFRGEEPLGREELPARSIVLTQWATGKNAARWRTELPRVFPK